MKQFDFPMSDPTPPQNWAPAPYAGPKMGQDGEAGNDNSDVQMLPMKPAPKGAASAPGAA